MPNFTTETHHLKHLLSEERLSSILKLTHSDEMAIELHQDILRLGTSLLVIIATIEIALRNSVCENLTLHFGARDWFLRPPLPFQWKQPERGKITAAIDSAKRSEYAKLQQTEKHALDTKAFPSGRPIGTSHHIRSKERRKQLIVPEGKVIAELTFFFWKRLYGPEYEHALWKTSLKRTFPYKKISRADVAIHLETIYQIRNRLAHHEPVIGNRYMDAMQSVKFFVQHLEWHIPSIKSPLAKMLDADIDLSEKQHKLIEAKLASFRKNKDDA